MLKNVIPCFWTTLGLLISLDASKRLITLGELGRISRCTPFCLGICHICGRTNLHSLVAFVSDAVRIGLVSGTWTDASGSQSIWSSLPSIWVLSRRPYHKYFSDGQEIHENGTIVGCIISLPMNSQTGWSLLSIISCSLLPFGSDNHCLLNQYTISQLRGRISHCPNSPDTNATNLDFNW